MSIQEKKSTLLVLYWYFVDNTSPGQLLDSWLRQKTYIGVEDSDTRVVRNLKILGIYICSCLTNLCSSCFYVTRHSSIMKRIATLIHSVRIILRNSLGSEAENYLKRFGSLKMFSECHTVQGPRHAPTTVLESLKYKSCIRHPQAYICKTKAIGLFGGQLNEHHSTGKTLDSSKNKRRSK